jgi:hypothetical protein
LRQLGVTLPWVGSVSIVTRAALKLAGPALWGTYGVADYAIDSSPEAKEFARLYTAVSKIQPDQNSARTYDAIGVLCASINKAGSTDPGKIRFVDAVQRDLSAHQRVFAKIGGRPADGQRHADLDRITRGASNAGERGRRQSRGESQVYAPSGQPHMVLPLTSRFPIGSGGQIAEWPPIVRVDAMIDYIAAQPLKPPQRASSSAPASWL